MSESRYTAFFRQEADRELRPLADTPDDELVARVACGDEAACGLLLERHLPRINALARRMLKSPEDAEEVAQEVFLRVWTQAEKWEPGRAQFRTWLFRVATNLCLDRLRRPRMDDLEGISEPLSADPDPEEALQQKGLTQRVEKALQTLPERQRAAIVLCHYQGLTNIEAAETLDISVEAVESLLSRARRQLRELLATEMDMLNV
jgi:RNA polymerase sigma-70 factor (ECF subfamily)